MTYYCEDCGFVFYGAGEIRECPYCGSQHIHASTREEVGMLRPLSEQKESNCNMN